MAGWRYDEGHCLETFNAIASLSQVCDPLDMSNPYQRTHSAEISCSKQYEEIQTSFQPTSQR
jgi:hypothetical protein